MNFKLFQLGTLLGIFLLGCQPHKQELSSSASTFGEYKTVYQLDSEGNQNAKFMQLSFTCVLEGATTSKRLELGFYQEPLSSKSADSYLELREVTHNSTKNNSYDIKELLVVDNLAISNLSVISLVVGKSSRLLGTQVNITSLPQLGEVFLEFHRQTGVGLFTAMSGSGTPSNMKCRSIRVP